jgi:hypothetical protein
MYDSIKKKSAINAIYLVKIIQYDKTETIKIINQ